MPRSQGTSRKGKPKKSERAAGMGRALERSQMKRFKPKSNGSGGGGGMAASGATSIGLESEENEPKIKSVLEVDSLTDFLKQSEMANREFTSEKERFVVLDPVGTEYDPSKPTVRWLDDVHYKPPSNFKFKELSVPRRPQWTSDTTASELHKMESETFLEWRRAIAYQEEQLHARNTNTVVTPFEKNLEVWRQLWRVMERSSCLIQIVDARNPLFYFSEDLRTYAETELGKPMLLVINKSDYLSYKQRKNWNRYFTNLGVNHVFFSAFEEQQILDGEAQRRKKEDWIESRYFEESLKDKDNDDPINNVTHDENHADMVQNDDIGVCTMLTREGLLHHLNAFARSNDCKPSPTSGRVEFGTIGFPNVGKSSIINVLIGASKHEHNTVRVGVAAQPGKTKHFQTILLADPFEDMMLCDCPGLVFPSFVSSTADLIAAGVFPLSQMREGQSKDVVRLIVDRIPVEILEAMYGIQVPRTSLEGKLPMTADLLLDTFCVTRSMLNASSGTPDHQRASRLFIKDYVSGKLLYCHPPPIPPIQHSEQEEEHKSQNDASSAFEKETFATLFQRTKKVREKLVDGIPQKDENENATENFMGEEDNEDNLGENDIDILELLDEYEGGGGGGSSDDILLDDVGKKSSSKKKKHYNKPQTKKWGKKGKKYRNKDPYGCHTDPDPLIYSSMAPGAIAGGKYGGQYTRPNYAGTRNAIPHERKNRG